MSYERLRTIRDHTVSSVHEISRIFYDYLMQGLQEPFSVTRILKALGLYAFTFLECYLVIKLKLAIPELGRDTPYLFLLLPILCTTFWTGLGPGIFGVLVSAAMIDYYFIPPFQNLGHFQIHDLVPFFMFLLEGTGAVIIVHYLKVTRKNMSNINEMLEEKVKKRTNKLRLTNKRLLREIEVRKRTEKELGLLNGQLKSSNKELEDLTYIASHDLQEPLRKIQAFSGRLKAKYYRDLNAEGQDYLNKMEKAADRMKSLINDLLSFSRVMSKKTPFETVNLDELCESVIDDFEAVIESEKARVIKDSLPHIEADPVQMRQLFQNLIGNSLKFIREDRTPQIRIYSKAEEGTNVCSIVVEDNGIGFDEKYKDRIFQVFEKLHAKEEYEGTGVGLAICKKIVERHQGSITAYSEIGKGAKFILTLPIRQDVSGSFLKE